MGAAGKEIKGFATVVKFLDKKLLDSTGQRRIIKEYVSPAAYNEEGLKDFKTKVLASLEGSEDLVIEFVDHQAVLKIGKRIQSDAFKDFQLKVKEELIKP